MFLLLISYSNSSNVINVLPRQMGGPGPYMGSLDVADTEMGFRKQYGITHGLINVKKVKLAFQNNSSFQQLTIICGYFGLSNCCFSILIFSIGDTQAWLALIILL